MFCGLVQTNGDVFNFGVFMKTIFTPLKKIFFKEYTINKDEKNEKRIYNSRPKPDCLKPPNGA